MNEEEFLQKIKGIKVNVPDEQFFLEYNAVVYNILKENQELKKQLEVGKEQYNDLVEEKEELQEQLSNSHQIKSQQREFIEYLNKYIKERRRLSKLHKKYSLSEERLSAQCHVLENVLLRYQETVGYKE